MSADTKICVRVFLVTREEIIEVYAPLLADAEAQVAVMPNVVQILESYYPDIENNT